MEQFLSIAHDDESRRRANRESARIESRSHDARVVTALASRRATPSARDRCLPSPFPEVPGAAWLLLPDHWKASLDECCSVPILSSQNLAHGAAAVQRSRHKRDAMPARRRELKPDTRLALSQAKQWNCRLVCDNPEHSAKRNARTNRYLGRNLSHRTVQSTGRGAESVVDRSSRGFLFTLLKLVTRGRLSKLPSPFRTVASSGCSFSSLD